MMPNLSNNRVPMVINGRAVDRLSEVKTALQEKTCDFPDLYNQWEKLLRLMKAERGNQTKTEPDIWKAYLEYILESNGRMPDQKQSQTEYDIEKLARFNKDEFEAACTHIHSDLNVEEVIKSYMHDICKFRKDGPSGIADVEHLTFKQNACWLYVITSQSIYRELEPLDLSASKKNWLFVLLRALYCRLDLPYQAAPQNLKKINRWLGGAGEESGSYLKFLREDRKTLKLEPMIGGAPYEFEAEEGSDAYMGPIKRIRLFCGDHSGNEKVTVKLKSKGGEYSFELNEDNKYRDILVNRKGIVLRVLPLLQFYPGEYGSGVTNAAPDNNGGFLSIKDGELCWDYEKSDMLFDRFRGWTFPYKLMEIWENQGYYYFLLSDGSLKGTFRAEDARRFYNRGILAEESYKL